MPGRRDNRNLKIIKDINPYMLVVMRCPFCRRCFTPDEIDRDYQECYKKYQQELYNERSERQKLIWKKRKEAAKIEGETLDK